MLIYVRGKLDGAAYIGHPMEAYERDLGKFWMPSVYPAARGTLDAMQLAVDHLKKFGADAKRIGVERAFLPAEAEALFRERPAQGRDRRGAPAA